MAAELASSKQTPSTGSRSPKIDVVSNRQVGSEPTYLLRLQEWGPSGGDAQVSYHVRRMVDFVGLNNRLLVAQEAGTTAIKELPVLPESGSFLGIRRRLSIVGLSDFTERQEVAMQAYCERLAAQIPSIASDPLLQAFFMEVEQPMADEAFLKATLMADAFSLPTLNSIMGHWTSNVFVWTVEEEGRVLLDGTCEGIEYSLEERGKGCNRQIVRGDGWAVDIAKSNDKFLFWTLHGKEVVWVRADEETAKSAIKRNVAHNSKLAVERMFADSDEEEGQDIKEASITIAESIRAAMA